MRSLPRPFALLARGVSRHLADVLRGVRPFLLLGGLLAATACQDTTAPVQQGSIALEFDGLPAGTSGQVRLSRGASSRTATGTSTIEGLDAGDWVLSASSVTIDGVVYEPQPATVTVNVPARSVGSARVVWTPTSGSLQLAVLGLPSGTAGDVLVTGQNFSRVVTASSVLTALRPGLYTIAVRDVRSSAGTLRADVQNLSIGISASAVAASASVTYALAPAAVDVTVSGLPGGTSSAISLTSPTGTVIPVGGTTRLVPVLAGRWRLTASNVSANGFTFIPTPAARDTTVSAGDTLRLPVAYAQSTGALAVAVTGLPQGATGSVTVTGPAGFSRALTATTTLTDLAPGTYTVSADSVVRSGFAWRPATASQQVTVSPSVTAAPATVAYSAVTGTLVVSLTGVPGGSTGSVRVTGPYGFDRTIAATTVFSATAAGPYVVTAASFVSVPLTYSVTPATVNRAVAIGGRDSVDMHYVSQSGSLQVTVAGLPGGANAALTLTGPQTVSITGSTTLATLASGSYTLAAAVVNVSGTNYAPSPSSQNITITTGGQSNATVTYAAVVTSGSLQVTVSGLPGGTNAAVTLTGPQTVNITGSTTIAVLAVGSYTLTAANVSASGTTYAPLPASQNITITNGVQSTATVAYTAVASAGSLQVTVSGLPGGTNAAVTLTGPQTVNITGSTTLAGLAVGNYTLTAANVSASGTTYTPAPTTQNVTISNGVQSSATVAYTAVSAFIDLVLDQAYLTQATQKPDGSVAMVAGRDALLRVFAHADRANVLTPTVRARVYDGAALLQTLTLTGPASGVPESLAEGTLTSTWNVVIAGANVRAATRVLVDIDPTNAVVEADETNNIWPRNGTPQTLTVNTVPTFNVRFVPVTVGSKTGNVTVGNMNSFLTTTRLIWPILDVSADVRAPFTSSADTLVSDDSNGKWLTVLSEMNTLRSVDGAPATTHYYGVVKVGYNSGVAGYGYVPGRAAMGWDYLPSGDGVAAHEWGHNFNRPHAPCGGAAGPDASYPYAGGEIGVFGWNSTTNALITTTTKDIMGYCNPKWVSDYNWTKVMTYRQASGLEASANTNGDGLLVWGRVVNGKVLLEPAFRVTAPRTSAVARPTHFVEALDADGNILMDLPITAEKVDHVTDHDERQFSVILPWSASLEQALSQLRVRDVRTPLLTASRASASAVSAKLSRNARAAQALVMPDPQSVVDAAPAGRMRVRWNAAQYPMAMVRDAATGQVMGYLRRSGDAVVSGGRRLELVYSDGVRSVIR
ncbi:MAG: hypothetical protein IPP90_00240 [Gemmatimonadaceae bacterium]|nr:hypothetical protein [Gemmatimonadaceae bacterium]